jgi:uncharacterized membrane protein YfcA
MDLLHQWVLPPEAQASAWVYVSVAIVAMLFTAVSKGGFGGGAGVVSVPLMLQVAPLPFVVGLWLPLLVASDVATIHHYPKEWRLRAAWKLVPTMLLGILLAASALSLLKGAASGPEAKVRLGAILNLGVAFITLVFVILWLRPMHRKDDQPWTPTWMVSAPVGLFVGICSTLAHAAGPLFTMYILPQRLDQRDFVGTTGRFFFLMNSLKVPFLVGAGLVTLHTLQYGLWLVLLAPLGVWLGSWLNQRLNPIWFLRVVYGCLAVVAFKLAWDAVWVLWR